MKSRLLFLLVTALAATCSLQAQTLFTYGGKPVDASEFIKSFRKNADGSEKDSIAVRKYLEPFIRYKLKVQAARDLKMDTLPNQLSDLASFREQIMPLYMLDSETRDSLLLEAHVRSGVEIETAYRFQAKDATTPADTGFQVIGHITAFTLPYAFENAVYSLRDGETTAWLETDEGLHQFKRVATRKTSGKRNVYHLLVAVPENASPEEDASRKKLADSLRQLIIEGAPFDSLAFRFSDDKSSAAGGGVLENIGVGQYDPAFEAQVFNLSANKVASSVFRTAFGYHILQLIERIPVPDTYADNEYALREQLMQDDRQQLAAKRLMERSIGKFGLTPATKDKEAYIRKNLEKFNPSFAEQIREFRDGNLLFEIMDKNVWSKATKDQAGLRNHFNQNRSKYAWQASLTITTITCINREAAELVRNAYRSERSADQIRKMYSEFAMVDTGRYERKDIQLLKDIMPYEGYVSDLHRNESDGSFSFVVVDKIHNDPSPKTFDASAGEVINDYQEYLEFRWIATLKKKYPIWINAAVWKQILQKADQNTLLTAL
jgi:peptidyl-prolyl cis-trans isomerase SurA